MRTHVHLLALLLVVPLSAASAALVPRRILLEDANICEGDCQKVFEERLALCNARLKARDTPCSPQEDPARLRDECLAACKLPCETSKSSACQDTCHKQWTEGTRKCNAGKFMYSASFGIEQAEKALAICTGQQNQQRDKCKEVCKRACKPAETPAGAKPPADTKPAETPAGTGSADTKPPAATTDTADSKPFGAPEEAGSAEPEHPAETGSHDAEPGEAADAGHP
jgi:hypothetical protein